MPYKRKVVRPNISFYTEILFQGIFQGNINENWTLEFGAGTEVSFGCGVTFHNEFWYFGGSSFSTKRQVNLFNLVDDS